MESKTLTLDDLSILNDAGFEGAVDLNGYVNAPSFTPVPAGIYRVKLSAIDFDKNENGELRDPRNPAFKCDFKIVEGPHEGREVRFIRISSKAMERKFQGQQKKASELADLIRAYDVSYDWGNLISVATTYLVQQVADGTTIKVRFDWKAWDKKYFDLSGGDLIEDGTEEKKKLMRECSVRGARKFAADGSHVNPASGNVLQANVYLAGAIDSETANK